jgi:glycosyltransferase involved in cell wall biosynthesis
VRHRVLHVATTLDPGGAENHLLTLARATRARGHRVDAAYLRGGAAGADLFRRAGARVWWLGARGRPGPGAVLRLAALIRRGRYTVVHAHLVEAEAVAALAQALAGGPALVVTRHNDDPFWRHPAVRALATWIGGRAERLIAISDHVRRSFEQLGAPAEKLVTVHYGLEAPSADLAPEAVRARLGVPPGAFVVGAVGRLVPQKGHAVLLDALARVPAVWLVLVGEGELEPSLRARAAELGLSDRVRFLGWRADAPELIGGFDVFAHPSLWEGFGLVLLEAMARGVPVVASRVSAIPEIVVDGQTGRLVPPRDPIALAEALAELVADRPGAAALGQAGRRRLDQQFTVDRMAAETIQVYDRATVGRPARSERRAAPFHLGDDASRTTR